jgi:SAM-dependent methyltransferase
MKARFLVPELMDDPMLDIAEHRRALNGLRRVNVFSGTAIAIARRISEFCEAHQIKSARILDLGCGSGDVAYGVARALPSNGQWHIEGWDISPTAIDFARQLHTNAKALQALKSRNSQCSLSFHQEDVFAAKNSTFDFVYCSLFLHHFQDGDAIRVLRRMRALAGCGLIVDDLNRSSLGFMLARIGVQILSRSPIVHFDGPQSVRAAFSIDEARMLAQAAGLSRITIEKRWPERWLLSAELHL